MITEPASPVPATHQVRAAMTDRERFLACVLGRPCDRPLYWLYFGPWRTTWERWQQEGMPPAAENHASLFGVETPPQPLPVLCGPCPRFEYQVLSDDGEFVVSVDSWGIVRRDFKHSESMSQFLDFPVKSRRDWERYKAERLDPDNPERLAGDWRARAAEWSAAGYPIQLGAFPDTGLFGGVRWLMGDEECLAAFCDAPDLIHDMMERLTDVYLSVFNQVVAEVQVDVIHIWEDMCGRQGPLIGPKMWERFMGPGYRRIKAFADAHHIPVISVDTDGNPDLIIPPMMRAGVNLLLPLEVAAGCDVNAMQRRYPELAFVGGIDKRALAIGPEAIDAELERIWPAVERGRFIPGLDHLVPDDVSWENYRYYAEALKRRVMQTAELEH